MPGLLSGSCWPFRCGCGLRAIRSLITHQVDLSKRLGTEPDLADALENVELVLHDLFRAAAQQHHDPALLGDLTVFPPARNVTALRTALSPIPAAVTGSAAPPGFVDQIEGDSETFQTKLRTKFIETIEAKEKMYVVGKGAVEHADPENLHDPQHIQNIATKAKESTDAVFGHLAVGPAMTVDRPGQPGNIHDIFTYRHAPDPAR